MAGAEGAVGADGTRDQQHDSRPQALATGGEEVLGGRLKNRVACPDQGAKIGQQGVEV